MTQIRNKQIFDPGRFSDQNKDMVGLVTTADGDQAVGIGIVDPVLTETAVDVFVNGMKIFVDPTAGEAFFRDSTGTITRPQAFAQQGDILYWQGSFAKYELDATDRIDYVYLTPSRN